MDDPPDLQSGYKLYSRESVERVVDALSNGGEDGEDFDVLASGGPCAGDTVRNA